MDTAIIPTVDRLEVEMTRSFLDKGSVMSIGVLLDGTGRIVGAIPDAGDGLFSEALAESARLRRAAAVFISAEAWSAFERSGAPPGPRPSDRPDRREVVLSQVETATFARTRVWPILRSGGSVRLGEMEEARPRGGRLTDVLRRSTSSIWVPPGALG